MTYSPALIQSVMEANRPKLLELIAAVQASIQSNAIDTGKKK